MSKRSQMSSVQSNVRTFPMIKESLDVVSSECLCDLHQQLVQMGLQLVQGEAPISITTKKTSTE